MIKSSSLSLSQFYEFSTTQTLNVKSFISQAPVLFLYKSFPFPSADHIKESAWGPTHSGRAGDRKLYTYPSSNATSHTKFPCLLSVARKRRPAQHQLGQGALTGQLLLSATFSFFLFLSIVRHVCPSLHIGSDCIVFHFM